MTGVTVTMLHRPEPANERVEPAGLGITAMEIPHSTKFSPIAVRVQRCIWRNHDARGVGLGFHNWDRFRAFWMTSSGPGPNPKRQFFVSLI